MQAISIHVVDIANGLVARGMRVDVLRRDGPELWSLMVTGTVGSNGLVDGIEALDANFEIGEYELRLQVADYYRALGTKLPEPAFMGVQVFRFALADLSRHYHLPVKLTPWGMSCFRGA